MHPEPLLYSELAPWFHLLTSPAEYAVEARRYARLIRHADPEARSLLELGSGGGNNAFHLKESFDCTLSDRSPEMLVESSRINPECEHVLGDMRSLRLGRTFDVVFVHDAVMYMTTEEDLRAAIETAYEHTSPGSLTVLVPDCTWEGFVNDVIDTGGHDGADGRRLRCLEWNHDPDPDDTTFDVDFVMLLREPGRRVRVVHDHHVVGLFPEHTWLTLLSAAGFDAAVDRSEDPESPQPVFIARRPLD